jgi:vancomycin permeability regulator SanA
MKKTKWIKRTIICMVAIVGVLAIIMAVCDRMVEHAAKNKLYETVEDVPHRKVGLVLGTSPISTWNGRRNYYFDHRIKSAAELYKAGKVDWLVVSGGDYRNTENGFDEPVAMRDVYRQDSIVIISQEYHNECALYQAKHLGIDAIGYNAKTPGRRTSWWNILSGCGLLQGVRI